MDFDETNRDKTAFSSHPGLYRFIHMPFGWRCAHGTFQRTMEVILPSGKWQFALVYLDDIAIFKSHEQHIEHVRKVRSLLSNEDLKLQPMTFRFFVETINYMRYV